MGEIKTQSSGSDARARRQWSTAQKLQIIQESEKAGVVKLEVCRRHGLHPSLVTKWRQQHRAGLLNGGGGAGRGGAAAQLLPVRVRPRPAPVLQARGADAALGMTRSGAIEVEFAAGQRLCIRGVVDAGMLRTVLEELARS